MFYGSFMYQCALVHPDHPVVCIAVSVMLDQMLNVDGGLRTLIITTFIFNEILSILENSGEIGIKIPNVLYRALEKINIKEEDKK